MAPIPVSHRHPPRGYDEPESLSYAISFIGPVSADGEQAAVKPRWSGPLNTPLSRLFPALALECCGTRVGACL